MSKNLALNAVALCQMNDVLLKSLKGDGGYAEMLEPQKQLEGKTASSSESPNVSTGSFNLLQLHRTHPIQATKQNFSSKSSADGMSSGFEDDIVMLLPEHLRRCSRTGFLFEELVMLAALQTEPRALEVGGLAMWMPASDFAAAAAAAAAAVPAAAAESPIESTSQLPSPSPQSLRHHYNAMYRVPSLTGTITSHPATSNHVTSMLKLLRSGTIGWALLKSSVWQLGRLLQNGSMPPLYVCCDMYVRPWGEAVFVALRSVTEAAVDGKYCKSSSSSVSHMVGEFEKSLRCAEENSIGLCWCMV